MLTRTASVVRRPHTAILGGGIAGLVAAYELCRRGHSVTVIEASSTLGGRASSWSSPAGDYIDPGLHVVARHYRNMLAVLDAVGSSNQLAWVDSHLFLRPGHPADTWKYSRLPRPLHLVRPGIGMKLSAADRRAFFKAAAAVWSRGRSGLTTFDRMTFLEWQQHHKIGSGLLADIGKASSDAATFLPPSRASAYAVLSWMRYMSRDARAGDIGIFTGGHEAAIAGPLRRVIEGFEGNILRGAVATRVVSNGRYIEAVAVAKAPRTVIDHAETGALPTSGGPERLVACDFMIAALPPRRLRALLSAEQVGTAGLTGLSDLSSVSAISLLLWFGQPITPAPLGVPLVCGRFVRDFVDLSRFRSGVDRRAVYQVVLSEIDELALMDDDEIVHVAVSELERLWPPVRQARVRAFDVHRVADAMFAALPGAYSVRPGTITGYKNAFLAGDWTHHDLNASMEGAAYSGRRAAEAVLEAADGMRETIALPPP